MLAVGLLVILYGVAKLYVEPGGMYDNYWGGLVYAPFVILVGVIAVVGALVQRRDTSVLGPKDRPVEFPHEGIDKPWSH